MKLQTVEWDGECWNAYCGYLYRIQGSHTGKNWWKIWILTPDNVALVPFFDQVLKRDHTENIHRGIRSADRATRKRINRYIAGVEREKKSWPNCEHL